MLDQGTEAPVRAVDFAALRRRFLTLDERAYFASQCLGPMPVEAIADLDEYRRTMLLRNRGIPFWIERVDETVALFEALLHAPPGSVALRESATGAQASIIAAIQPRPERRRLLFTSLDFHSSRYLWRAQVSRGFEVEEILSPDNVEFATERLVDAIDERTAVVAAALVSPRSGALLDAQRVIRAAHEHGAIVVLDVYQAVGVFPVDVLALDADVVVGGTHKWLSGGGAGLAFLYVRPSLAERLEPAYPGWLAHDSIMSFSDVFTPAPGARRFQMGFLAMEPIYTARAGLRIALEVGLDTIRARNLALLGRLDASAGSHGLPVRAPSAPERRAGFVCLDVPGGDRIVEKLEARGIDVDYRPGAGVRIGPHFCHREDECDRVVAAIAEARG